MNDCTDETTLRRHTAAIPVRENVSGAPVRKSIHHQYGRRVEADSSWSVYHVFTGVPVDIEGCSMTGLSRSEATDRMMALNRHNKGDSNTGVGLTEVPGPRQVGEVSS